MAKNNPLLAGFSGLFGGGKSKNDNGKAGEGVEEKLGGNRV